MLIHDHKADRINSLAGTFAGLMDLYERNYIGMRRLVPDVPVVGMTLISKLSGGLDLHLTVLECHRYTTEFLLTYHFWHNQNLKSEPNLCVRVYHDARQAEVLSAQLRSWPFFAHLECTELHVRWRVNRILYKWLSYCLHQGHCFQLSEAVSTS